ncbi:MAG: T9SS type A sorting domain-containing protein [Bacteroidales bacterium]|nr:T9SS type A sorting domain-containing protein [Bacteroidales bacterium]MDT8432389.1 T9SS type A sorting domain-containing protein [Bacteroidales bacterium]
MKKFTKFWMLVFLVSHFATQAQDGLFISEIADPADEYTGRFIELFNAGSETVDFGTTVMYLTRQSNGGTTWGTVQLTGTVAPGRTYVIGGSAFESLYGFAPDLVTGILTGNGDDPYSLYIGGNHETGSLHDIYGATNTDGTGEAWEYTDSRAVRDEYVDGPGMLWFASEWTIAPAGIADCDPGTHNGSPGGGPVVPVGDFAIYVASDTVEAGEPFQLGILVSELFVSDDIISYQFDIAYDASFLEYTYASVIGTIADGGTLAENNTQPGMVSISYMTADPLIGSGEILLLTFNTLGMGSTDVTLSNAFLNNLSVTELYGGNVLVSESNPPSAIVTYSDTVNRLSDMLQITAIFSEEMDPANPVTLEMTGAVTESALEMVRLSATEYSYLYFIPRAGGTVNVQLANGADMNGNPVVAAPTAGGTFDIIPLRPGDVNDDGVVQAYDAALALQHSVGLDPMPEVDPLPWEAWRDSTANINRDGSITAYDAGLILQYSVGIQNVPGMKKSAGIPDEVILKMEDGYIVVYANEGLLGLNISADDHAGRLGVPEFPSARFLSASNISATTYRAAVCTDEPPAEGTVVMLLPCSGEAPVELEITVNTNEYHTTVDMYTGNHEELEAGMRLYPNPADGFLMVSGPGTEVHVQICDIRGRVVLEKGGWHTSDPLDVGDLAPGIYMIRMSDNSGQKTGKFVKQ